MFYVLWPLTQFNRRRPRVSDRFARIQIYERLYLYLSLLHWIPKKTQDICAISGFMRLSYYIRSGETNVCETYSILYTLQNIYDPYIIEENENFFYWFSMSTYTVSVSTIAGSGLPNPNSCGGGGTIFRCSRTCWAIRKEA